MLLNLYQVTLKSDLIKVETVYKIKSNTIIVFVCKNCALFFFTMCINYQYSSPGLCDTGDIQEKHYKRIQQKRIMDAQTNVV